MTHDRQNVAYIRAMEAKLCNKTEAQNIDPISESLLIIWEIIDSTNESRMNQIFIDDITEAWQELVIVVSSWNERSMDFLIFV